MILCSTAIHHTFTLIQPKLILCNFHTNAEIATTKKKTKKITFHSNRQNSLREQNINSTASAWLFVCYQFIDFFLLFLHAFNWLADYVIHMIQHRWSRKILFNFHQKNRSNPRNSIIIVHYNSTYSLSWQTLFIYLRYPFKIFANSHSISFSIYFFVLSLRLGFTSHQIFTVGCWKLTMMIVRYLYNYFSQEARSNWSVDRNERREVLSRSRSTGHIHTHIL